MKHNASLFVLLAALVSTLPETAASQDSGKIPAEAFGALPFMSKPALSPNGEKVAFIAGVEGEQKVAVAHLFDRSAGITLFGSGAWDLRWVKWASDDRLLLSIGSQVRFVNTMLYVTRVLAVDADGGNALMIGKQGSTQIADRIVYLPPQGGDFVLMALSEDIWSYPDVYNVDIRSGRQRRVEKAREYVNQWFADADGTVRFGYAYNPRSNSQRIYYRPEDGRSLATLEVTDYDVASDSISPVAFTADPNIILVLSDQETGRDELFEYDVSERSLSKKIFSVEGYDIGGVILSPDQRSVAGVTYVDDLPRIHWLDEEMKAVHEAVSRNSPPDTYNDIISMSADQNRMIVRRGGARLPDEYYFYDRSRNQMQLIGKAYERLTASDLSDVKAVSYRARDGLRIPAYLTLPDAGENKGLPMVLMPHGGPWARDHLTFDYWAQFFASRGYAVLQPNFRGSTGYGERYTALGEGEWGKAMQDDLEDAVGWAVREEIADPSRICILGGSYGGYAAMMGAAKTPGLFRCAVSFAGVSDLPSLLRYDRNFLYYKTWKATVAGDGSTSTLNDVSPITLADRITDPLLLIHGRKDIRVPVDQTENMAAALSKSGKNFEVVLQPDGDHNLSRQEDRIRFLEEAERFLMTHNPPGPAAAGTPSVLVASLVAMNGAREFYSQRQYDDAIAFATRAMDTGQLNRDSEINMLSVRATARGYRLQRCAEAASDYERLLTLSTSTGFRNAYAWMLATCPEDAGRNGARAVALAREAVAASDNPDYVDTLAAALAEAGQYEEAAQQQREYLAMFKPEWGETALKRAQERLANYEEGKPWRLEPVGAEAE